MYRRIGRYRRSRPEINGILNTSGRYAAVTINLNHNPNRYLVCAGFNKCQINQSPSPRFAP